ncbi:MAG: hypothetical protein FWC11_00930 [Firmicutes bacterium]|nr:hypothetical protein [Bacillota bacterium]
MNPNSDFENPDDEEPPIVSSSLKKSISKRIALSAVCVALASLMIVVTNLVPFFTFFPLMIVAFCFIIAFEKAGIVYGFLTIIISVLISAFIWPLSLTFFLTVLIFAPYSFVAFLAKKLIFTKWKTMLIRIGVMMIFANIVLLFCYLVITVFALAQGTSLNIESLFSLHYVLIALIFIPAFLVFDFVSNQATIQISRRIKI